jgi:DNA polymerase I-like protein with 3'-5' exonuclease and polymerase domains
MRDERRPVAFDIETVANETACIGFANDSRIGACINFRTLTENMYSLREERDLRRRIDALLIDPSVRLIAQNGTFDSYWLQCKDRINVGPVWFDTLLAHHTLYPALPHNLGFLTSQYTDHPYYKDDGKTWKEGGDIDQFWRYNVKDVCITYEVHKRLHKELIDAKLDKFFFEHVMRLQPHLIRMTVQGILVDSELKTHIAEAMREDVARLQEKFYEYVGIATSDPDYRPSPRSPTQLRDLLFRRLQLVGRGASTDEANRTRMLNHHGTSEAAKDVIRALDSFKKDDKFLTTYAEMTVDPDGRIRSEYKQYGTQKAPGRLSSSGVMWGSGGNLQNIPEDAHPMFVADEGYSFGYFDLSQAEARVVGWLAGIDKWKEQFERARFDGSYDCHRALAAEMFEIPYDEVPSKDRIEDENGNMQTTLRFIAKRCVSEDTEVLTRSGWEKISHVCYLFPSEEIAVWNPKGGTITWEAPMYWHRSETTEDLYEINNVALNQLVTEDHELVIMFDGKTKRRSIRWILDRRTEGSRISAWRLPLNGVLQSAGASKSGVLEEIERIMRMLKCASEKMYVTTELFEWSIEDRRHLFNLIHSEDCRYRVSPDIDSLSLLQAVAHVSGYRCLLSCVSGSSCLYRITIAAVKGATIEHSVIRKVPYKGSVYCPTVSTGAFLMRRNKSVSVTGNCRHGLNYRMQAPRLAETTGMPLHKAEEAFTLYHRATPELVRWWQKLEREIRTTRMLYNAYGRRLVIMGRLTDDAMESIVAFKPQSTIGDKVSRVVYLCHEDDDWPVHARIILNIHDALVCIAPHDKIKTCLAIMKKHAEEPIPIGGELLIIPAELKISCPTSWEYNEETGRVTYHDDPNGKHRWYGMKGIDL